MASKRMGPVQCNLCGHTWDIDPVYTVDCPDCRAPAGKLCTRPSEHEAFGGYWHAARDLAAAAAGAYAHQCTHEATCPCCKPKPRPAPATQLSLI